MAELKELAEFYARAAAMKDPVVKFDGRLTGNIGPEISGSITRWTVEERQPDFQCLIDSGIDCEFSNDREHWYIGKLSDISSDKLYPYISDIADIGRIWSMCRPRLNHPHAWIATEDSKCPVPEGYEVKVRLANKSVADLGPPSRFCWNSNGIISEIVSFEVREK